MKKSENSKKFKKAKSNKKYKIRKNYSKNFQKASYIALGSWLLKTNKKTAAAADFTIYICLQCSHNYAWTPALFIDPLYNIFQTLHLIIIYIIY